MTGKISEDVDVGSLSGAEMIPVAVAATNKRTSPSSIAAYISSAVLTFTGKTIDAASNVISNLTTSMFATGVIDTDGTLTGNSDVRLPTQKAVKTYVDAHAGGGGGSGDVVGPAGAVLDRIATFANTSGKLIKDGGQTIANLTVPPATAAPLMDGTAAVGAATKYAREDHIHPTDTTRAAASALPAAATATPLVESGSGAVGTATKYAREDHIHPASIAPPCAAGGRLTLTTAVPVPPADVTAATSVFYTPHSSSYVPIYNGSVFVNTVLAGELTLALDSVTSDTGYHQAGKNFDLFVFSDGGTIRLGSSPAWTGDTARSAAITLLQGIYVNTAAITLRFGSATGNTVSVSTNAATYVGTFRASANGQCEDSREKRFLWNSYNQVQRQLRKISAIPTENNTGAGTSWYLWLNSAANKVEFVRGLDTNPVFLRFDGLHSVSGGGTAMVTIGLDSTSASSADLILGSNSTATVLTVAAAVFRQHVSAGYHFLQLLERPGATSTTFFGALANPVQYGADGYMKG